MPGTAATSPGVAQGGPGHHPAGGAAAAPGAVFPAGPRTWTLEMPAGLRLLSLNGREHWAERNRRSQALKKAAWALALRDRLPHLDRVSIVVEYQPPDARNRDADNAATASGKPCIDGLVAAQVLPGDESPRHVTRVTYQIGERYPRGRLVLHITEAGDEG